MDQKDLSKAGGDEIDQKTQQSSDTKEVSNSSEQDFWANYTKRPLPKFEIGDPVTVVGPPIKGSTAQAQIRPAQTQAQIRLAQTQAQTKAARMQAQAAAHIPTSGPTQGR